MEPTKETTGTHMDTSHDDNVVIEYDTNVVDAMMEACVAGDFNQVQSIIETYGDWYAGQQVDATGSSPLMATSNSGHTHICQYLLEQGAPWNAIDRNGQCAGNVATDREHWEIVNLLVEWGTRAELILGRVERGQRRSDEGKETADEMVKQSIGTESSSRGDAPLRPVEHEPSTKPDYLRQRLQYTTDGQSLLDADEDAVMMEWERPLMRAHAQLLMEPAASVTMTLSRPRKRVLNVGFGMGIIDTALQEWEPSHHIIIEAHPDVYQRMVDTGWTTPNNNVRVCFGKWQDVMPQLIAEGVVVDAIFYDTYGEHFLDLEDFHTLMIQILAKPDGVYSFFNGLAPDNLFFHGVACQCVKLQLASLGLDSEFLSCAIQVQNEVWEGIRRKYWHGRDTYYLPVCKWNAHFLQTGQAAAHDWGTLDSAHVARLQAGKRKVAHPQEINKDMDKEMNDDVGDIEGAAASKRLQIAVSDTP